MILTILIIVIILWVIQFFITASINDKNDTRWPNDLEDWIKLTWLPYVLNNLNHIKRINPTPKKTKKSTKKNYSWDSFVDNMNEFKENIIEEENTKNQLN